MLYLIGNNKSGRNISNSGNVDLSFKPSEDSLTSSIFSLLFYLPAEVSWKILYNSCYYPQIPKDSGRMVSYSFWPHWNCHGTTNTNLVEPDIFIRYENFDLLIEAKLSDYKQQQNTQQWQNEIRAYYNEFAQNGWFCKPLYFIALGGFQIGFEKSELIELENPNAAISITKCRWKNILFEIKSLITKLESSKNISTSINSILFILQDLLFAFSIHGFLIGELLYSMPSNILIDYPSIVTSLKFKKNLLETD